MDDEINRVLILYSINNSITDLIVCIIGRCHIIKSNYNMYICAWKKIKDTICVINSFNVNNSLNIYPSFIHSETSSSFSS